MMLAFCLILMLTVVLGAKPLGKRLERRWPAPAGPEELTAAEEARLQAIADVPLVDIIEAAERRATHPDEPLPKILADLDPETRAQDTAPADSVGVEVRPSLGGFLNGFSKPQPGNGFLILEPGMDCKVVPINPPAAPKHSPAPELYANCTHDEASREEVHTAESAAPVASFVTECSPCERIAELQGSLAAVAEEIRALVDSFELDSNLMTYKVATAREAQYRELVHKAQEIKRLLGEERSRGQAVEYRIRHLTRSANPQIS